MQEINYSRDLSTFVYRNLSPREVSHFPYYLGLHIITEDRSYCPRTFTSRMMHKTSYTLTNTKPTKGSASCLGTIGVDRYFSPPKPNGVSVSCDRDRLVSH